MNKVVLDSSAVLAFINDEVGGDVVKAVLADSLLLTVNLTEVTARLILDGRTPQAARKIIEMLELDVVGFDRELAEHAGEMVRQTRAFGLSLGDRACLALAAREKLPVLTADRAWQGVNLGIETRMIR